MFAFADTTAGQQEIAWAILWLHSALSAVAVQQV
jgi:hypothetical protein